MLRKDKVTGYYKNLHTTPPISRVLRLHLRRADRIERHRLGPLHT